MKALDRAALFQLFTSSLHATAPRIAILDIQLTDNLLFDLGLDSLEAIDLVTRMIKQTGLELSPTIIAQVTTIDSLLDLFEDEVVFIQAGPASKEKDA